LKLAALPLSTRELLEDEAMRDTHVNRRGAEVDQKSIGTVKRMTNWVSEVPRQGGDQLVKEVK